MGNRSIKIIKRKQLISIEYFYFLGTVVIYICVKILIRALWNGDIIPAKVKEISMGGSVHLFTMTRKTAQNVSPTCRVTLF